MRPISFRDVLQLAKLRLTLVVVASALLGYMIGVPGPLDWCMAGMVVLGGLLVTASSNTLNQLLEIRQDAQMKRTAERPLPTGRMHAWQALLIAVVLGLAGIAVLWLGTNPLCTLLGGLSLLAYSFVYTPAKKIGPWAVFIGAFPGAMPPLIGYAAATGHLGREAGILFLIQFIWQFPHFWAIAWLAHDEYRKAGYHLLPSRGGKDTASAIWIVVSAAALLPAIWLPYWVGMSGQAALWANLVQSTGFLYLAWRLYTERTNAAALLLMFGSFLYLPLMLLGLFLDKHF